jgi:hypothetical protein
LRSCFFISCLCPPFSFLPFSTFLSVPSSSRIPERVRLGLGQSARIGCQICFLDLCSSVCSMVSHVPPSAGPDGLSDLLPGPVQLSWLHVLAWALGSRPGLALRFASWACAAQFVSCLRMGLGQSPRIGCQIVFLDLCSSVCFQGLCSLLCFMVSYGPSAVAPDWLSDLLPRQNWVIGASICFLSDLLPGAFSGASQPGGKSRGKPK